VTTNPFISLRWGLVSGLALFLTCGTAIAQPGGDGDRNLIEAETLIEAGRYGAAVDLLAPQADAGDDQAQALLAHLYSQGLGVPQNFVLAAELNSAAAAHGNPRAQNALGKAYIQGLGVASEVERGLDLLEQAAQTSRAEYQADLAVALEAHSDRVAEAGELYRLASEQGHIPSMTSLGVLYMEGRGVERDALRAMSLFSQAAEQGDARAQNNLGLMFVRGEDVERDYDQAFRLFEMAAQQGLREGLTNLSVMYESGFGVAVDEDEARRLLAEARRQGSFSLAALLDEIGFTFDPRLVSPRWEENLSQEDEQGALAGDPVSLYRTAFRYLNGYGVRQNMPLGLSRLEEAAEAGLGGAQMNLGVLYAMGLAVPQDYENAYVWSSLAAFHGTNFAGRLRDALAVEMSGEQLLRAQDRVQHYLSVASP